jgi:hypothetical protein
MERRSDKDRRKHIDPCYQSAAYPEFVDRRSGRDRRKRSYQDLPGHPTQKWIIVMGVVVTLSIISLFFLTSLLLTEKCRDKTVPKKPSPLLTIKMTEGMNALLLGSSDSRTPGPCFS